MGNTDSSENSSSKTEHDEVDLGLVVRTLWSERKTIAITTTMAAILSVIYAILQPNIYSATTILAPVESEVGTKPSGFSQIAAFAGIGGNNQSVTAVDIAISTLTSYSFITSFIKKNDILVPLMAHESWDSDENKLVIDDNIYDQENKKWLVGDGTKPSDWVAYEAFIKLLNINQDKTTGIITISLDFQMPSMATNWLRLLIKDLNDISRDIILADNQKRINYLNEQLDTTTVNGIRNILFQLIEEQLQTSVLAQTREELVLRTIDPAYTPDQPSRPARTLIAIIGTILGGMLGAVIVLFRRRKTLG